MKWYNTLIATLTVLLLVTAMLGCTTTKPDAVVINGASVHVLSPEKDSTNPGIGLRYQLNEFGFYDNSRIKESYAYYASRRMLTRGPFFGDLGVAWYDSKSNYSAHWVPMVTAGVKIGPAELAYSAPDILHVRLVIQ